MLTNRDHALGQVLDLPPLPPHAKAQDILADCLPILDAPSRVSPIEAAERSIRVEARGVWKNYDADVTPYMVEPINNAQNRLYLGGAFVGPSQAGKTLGLITSALHPVLCDPAPVLVIHMDRPSRDRWVEESLDPVIMNSPEVYRRLGKGRDDSTFSRKRFLGMRLMLGYPTPQWLSSAKYKLVALTDYDHFPPELGVRKDAPEGSPFDMAIQRVKTYLSRGYVAAESTPAWPVIKKDWSPRKSAPHELPPVKHGIVLLYNQGTRGRWYWECPDCKSLFEPRVDRLVYKVGRSDMESAQSAQMECPHCQAKIGPHHKNELNRAAYRGAAGWLHEAEHGGELVPLGDSNIRGSEIASWALNGAAATFAKWPELIYRKLAAEQALAELDDDLKLKRFYYTDVGVPYSSPKSYEDGELSDTNLRSMSVVAKPGIAPPWVRFITVSVDVQGTYFTVQVTGFGIDRKRTVIDRFDLTQPPADGDGVVPRRKLSPAKFLGDWDVLKSLDARSWRIEGTPHSLQAVALGVDFHGEAGVSDNAEEFWLNRKKAGSGSRWFLTRGHGGFKQRDRVWHEAPERSNSGKKRKIKLLNMATDRLKDTVTAALLRPADVPRSFPLPEFLSNDHVSEFCAEERGDKGWSLKEGEKRNESLDLSVQAQAMAEHKGMLRMNPEAPFNWARLDHSNPYLQSIAEDDKEAPPVEPKKRKRRMGRMRIS